LSISRKIALKWLDGFAEWGKPYGWAAIEQGTAERHYLLQVALGLEERGNQVKDEEYQRDHSR
jgi:hypothetical protein